MITLSLFGGALLLVALIQLARRMRRSKSNAYERFLRDRTIDALRVEEMRTYKLRMATHPEEQGSAPEAAAQLSPRIDKADGETL